MGTIDWRYGAQQVPGLSSTASAKVVARPQPATLVEAMAWLRRRSSGTTPPEVDETWAALERAITSIQNPIVRRETLSGVWQLALAAHYLTGTLVPSDTAKGTAHLMLSELFQEVDKFFSEKRQEAANGKV